MYISVPCIVTKLKSQITDYSLRMHVSKLVIIDSGNGFSPGRRHAIIWTNAGILLIGSLE